MQSILAKKRRGLSLTKAEIAAFVETAAKGDQCHDAQIGAMLMAICINGMTAQETADLTSAMVNSGVKMSWSGKVADKHSTGGVGDKVSIPLAPILAELGLKVPMISGRCLDITGGTLDKLESIPGFRVDLTIQEMQKCMESCGCFISAATKDLCPADKKTYSIRDVTSTVYSTPLITASILSKKIAEGCEYLIQDIKVGEAAFYKDIENAEELARTMIATAKLNGLKMAALLTRMDQPLGRAVGNALEIEESIDILKGTHYPQDLMELILELGSQLLVMSDRCSNVEKAKIKMKNTIENGTALKRFYSMLISQGVNEIVANNLCYSEISNVLSKAKFTTDFKVPEDGYIEMISGLKVGTTCFKLGSGRNTPTDDVDHTVGCRILKCKGDKVKKGTTWAILHHNGPLSTEILEEMNKAVKVSPQPTHNESLIIKTITSVIS